LMEIGSILHLHRQPPVHGLPALAARRTNHFCRPRANNISIHMLPAGLALQRADHSSSTSARHIGE
jgi:hypothetical protein